MIEAIGCLTRPRNQQYKSNATGMKPELINAVTSSSAHTSRLWMADKPTGIRSSPVPAFPAAVCASEHNAVALVHQFRTAGQSCCTMIGRCRRFGT
jgi:hypothetical protein